MATSDNSGDSKVKEFYPHDLVYKFDDEKRIILGVVTEWSESEEISTLYKEHIPVLWSNSKRRQICRQSKLKLMSRNLERGDLVRRLEDGEETQRGYLKRIKETVTVQIVQSDKVIERVANRRLCFIKPFEVGDAVCLGDKYGTILNIDYVVWMQSKCGSIVEFGTCVNYAVYDHWRGTRLEDFGYPGQVVACVPMHLHEPKWIKKSKTMMRKADSRQTFTILRIVPCSVEVRWLAPRVRFDVIQNDDIKKLKVLAYSENAITGDRQFLRLKPSDVVVKKRVWQRKKFDQYLDRAVDEVPKRDDNHQEGAAVREAEEDWLTEEDDTDSQANETGSKYKSPRIRLNARRRSMSSKCAPGCVVPVEILCTDLKATVVWQDGSEEKDIPTTKLYFSVALDDHEFFPGDCVLTNNSNVADRYAVVQKVDFRARTASIKWFSYSEVHKRPMEGATEEASVYDLKAHPKFAFRPGNFVRAKPLQENRMGKVLDCRPEGHISVHWLDDSREDCWPQHLDVLPIGEDFDYQDDSLYEDDLSDDAHSWETESVESYEGDVIDDVNLQVMASKVDFIRSRIVFLMEATKDHSVTRNFQFVKDLLCVYDNSSYLDKYLGTSFFSRESKHFEALLIEAKKKAESLGIELKGRIFSNCDSRDLFSTQADKFQRAEMDNIEKMINLEHKVNAQIEGHEELNRGKPCPTSPGAVTSRSQLQESPVDSNLCVELLHMLKLRMNLVYAEILSRIGSRDALTALTDANENPTKPVATPSLNPSNASLPSDKKEENLQPPSAAIGAEAPSKAEPFCMLEEAPDTHRYYSIKFRAKDPTQFAGALRREYRLLRESLPPGVWVRTYESRTDLLSVMIRGPAKTPYEDGLFLFDVQLSADYPKTPPRVHYISYIGHALNPNLYVEGKVCVSLLGTWAGQGSEVWGPDSTLLQVVVSIQGLILVAEPFYNEAGYEKHANTQQGTENSRIYNEIVLLKLVQSMTELLNVAPKIFQAEILEHFRENGEKMCDRLESFCEDDCDLKPEFPLLPVSRGLKMSLKSAIATFRSALESALC